MDDGGRTDRDFVHSLARGLHLVRTFDRDHAAMTLDEVAARSGISRSASRRLLRTLATLGYVRFDGHQYTLAPRLLTLGYAQQSRLTLADVARPHCEALAGQLGGTVSLAVLDHDEVSFLLRCGPRRIMSVALSVGSRLPAHPTAIGRVLLAALPADQLDAYLATVRLDGLTSRSVTAPEALRTLLMAVSAQGWSVVEQELEEGLSAVAVPVRDRSGRVVAAINATDHATTRGWRDREVSARVDALRRTAAQIGLDLHPSHVA